MEYIQSESLRALAAERCRTLTLGCEASGMLPGTVRTRLAPRHSRDQAENLMITAVMCPLPELAPLVSNLTTRMKCSDVPA